MSTYNLTINQNKLREDASDMFIITSLAVILAFSPLAMSFGFMAFSDNWKQSFDNAVLPVATNKEDNQHSSSSPTQVLK